MSTVGNLSKKMRMKLLESSWSDLPIDIIILIVNHLGYLDRIRFRAVCKHWRVSGFVKYADKLPWVMAYNEDSCYLYDPSQKQTYTVGEKENLFGKARVVCSKHGWALFSETTEDTASFFFYSPFTNKIIKLVPGLHNSKCLHTKSATFSKGPTSCDCVLFVFRSFAGKYCISLCKVGDQTWTEFWFNCRYGWLLSVSVEYADGVFYCCFPNKQVIGAFHVELQTWKLFHYPKIFLREESNLLDYLIECDGDLFIAQYVFISNFSWWRVLKLDRSGSDSKIRLIEVKDYMDDRLLFLGCLSSISISVEKENELSRVVHWHKRSCYYDCPCFSGFLGRGLNLRPECNSLCPKIYDDGFVWKCKFTQIWIQSPQLTE